ncbi:unnamed protein product [Musa hybrid cultivar]
MTTRAAMISSVQILSLAVSQQCCRHPWPLFMQQRKQNTGDLFFSSKIPQKGTPNL